ncbi:MAG TPA: dTMP kinase [Oligoflexia bacterium]|nr:dTMP kinase [Oligoflexia bacterium]HMP47290.1 dTMP kinase [Oligoflexia bacterium]
MKSGAFFCIEGIEGSGKSSLITALGKTLADNRFCTVITREPGGTIIGQSIRNLLLANNSKVKMSTLTELLLFFADRSQHLEEIILPSLKSGKTVLCDRYIYSTLAYQCYGRGLPRYHVDTMIDILKNYHSEIASILPLGVILIDIDPETGLKRALNRASLDRFESEAITFHQNIRNGFLELAKEDKERFLILDGEKPLSELCYEAYQFICNKLSAINSTEYAT